MKNTIKNAIRALCTEDESIRTEDIDRALSILDGRTTGDIRLDRAPVSYETAARMLGVSRRSVVRYVGLGVLKKVKIGNEKRGHRLVREDVEALRDGKTIER